MRRLRSRIQPVASRLVAGALLASYLGLAASRADELGYMTLFSDEEMARPHVEAASHELFHDFIDGQWEGIIAASDSNTYFSVSSHSSNHNAQFYVYDSLSKGIRHLIDVADWCGEGDAMGKFNVQGKIHSRLFEVGGKLYASSTSAHRVPERPYRGGHFLSYDLKTETFSDLGLYPDSEGGLLTLHYEPVFRRLYAISQGKQTLCYYALDSGRIVTLGSIEDNPHQCRVLISDTNGVVYGSTWGHRIFRYDPRADQMSCLLTDLPHDPKASQPVPNPEDLAWRSTHWTPLEWDPVTAWWYGVKGNDEYLFRFRPPPPGSHRAQVEGLAPFGFLPSDVQPRFASLALVLRGRTLYYCSYPVWKPTAHLMSYAIDTGKVTDHGPIIVEGRRRVSEIHSMVLGSDGSLHAVAMVWSVKGKDPTPAWANRAQCHFHARFLRINPDAHFKPATAP